MVPTSEHNKFVQENALNGFLDYISYRQNEIVNKEYKDAIINKTPVDQITRSYVDPRQEGRQYLAIKFYDRDGADYLELDDYKSIRFRAPNGLPEMINDITLTLFG